jgi:hypothetical protein
MSLRLRVELVGLKTRIVFLELALFILRAVDFPVRRSSSTERFKNRIRSWQKAGEARVRSMRLGTCLKSGTSGWLKKAVRHSPTVTSVRVKNWAKKFWLRPPADNETKLPTDKGKTLFDKGE